MAKICFCTFWYKIYLVLFVFNFDYMRKSKLRNIKKVRAIRDAILLTKNGGRVKTLLLKMPNVTGYSLGYHDNYYGSGNKVTITLEGGFTHSFSGYGDGVKFINQAGEFAYMKWVKNYCK
jgi:hypothetical protein